MHNWHPPQSKYTNTVSLHVWPNMNTYMVWGGGWGAGWEGGSGGWGVWVGLCANVSQVTTQEAPVLSRPPVPHLTCFFLLGERSIGSIRLVVLGGLGGGCLGPLALAQG